ncbi:unnamed protein product [Sphagnum balticum]
MHAGTAMSRSVHMSAMTSAQQATTSSARPRSSLLQTPAMSTANGSNTTLESSPAAAPKPKVARISGNAAKQRSRTAAPTSRMTQSLYAHKPPRPTKLVGALVNQSRKMAKSVQQPMKSVDKSPPSTPPNTKRQRSSSAARAAPIVQQQNKTKLAKQSPSPPRVDEKAETIVRQKPIRKPVAAAVDPTSPVQVVNGIDSPPTMPQPPIDIEQELHESAMSHREDLPLVEVDSVLVDMLDMPSPTITGEYNRRTRSVEPADEHVSKPSMPAHTPSLLIDVMDENIALTSSQPQHVHSPIVESTREELYREVKVCKYNFKMFIYKFQLHELIEMSTTGEHQSSMVPLPLDATTPQKLVNEVMQFNEIVPNTDTFTDQATSADET